jgi:hypothetical protein
MPYKAGGKFHLEGCVRVCSESALLHIISTLKPIIDLLECPILFLSPIPRYLYNGCCSDSDHCVGVDTEPYMSNLMQETLALRSVCKKGVLGLGKKNIWVPDLVGKMLPACNGATELSVGWKTVAAADGVHLTGAGYQKLADTLIQCTHNLLCFKKPAVSYVSALGRRSRTFYWRGFASPAGSDRPKNPIAAYKASHRGGGGKWRGHPVSVGRGRGVKTRPPYYKRN